MDWLEGGSNTSLWRIQKLIGYFEKVSGPSQAQSDIFSLTEDLSLFLSLSHTYSQHSFAGPLFIAATWAWGCLVLGLVLGLGKGTSPKSCHWNLWGSFPRLLSDLFWVPGSFLLRLTSWSFFSLTVTREGKADLRMEMEREGFTQWCAGD